MIISRQDLCRNGQSVTPLASESDLSRAVSLGRSHRPSTIRLRWSVRHGPSWAISLACRQPWTTWQPERRWWWSASRAAISRGRDRYRNGRDAAGGSVARRLCRAI